MVFHTCPEATATYHSLWLFGFTAKSAIRPDVNAGPIERHFNPPKVDDLMESDLVSCFADSFLDVSFLGDSVFAVSFFTGSFFALAFCANAGAENRITARSRVASIPLNRLKLFLFILVLSLICLKFNPFRLNIWIKSVNHKTKMKFYSLPNSGNLLNYVKMLVGSVKAS